MHTKLVSSLDDISRSRLVTIKDDALLMDGANLLARPDISLVVVCGADGAMVGVITKTNIVRLIGGCCGSACRTRAADVMTADVTYCRPADDLHEVLEMMQERGFVHLPVIDESSCPVGVITARDALRVLVAQGEYEETLLRNYVMGVGYR